jgi:hypothetical protein
MNTTSLPYPAEKSPYLTSVLLGGLISGSCDLTFAFIYNGSHGYTPLRVLQTIASGWLGMDSFQYGYASAALGVLSHYFILTVAAALFLAASRKVNLLTQRAILFGILYGVAIYLVMNFVVLPLSAAPKFKRTLQSTIFDLSAHMFLIGPAIALTVRKYFKTPAQS